MVCVVSQGEVSFIKTEYQTDTLASHKWRLSKESVKAASRGAKGQQPRGVQPAAGPPQKVIEEGDSLIIHVTESDLSSKLVQLFACVAAPHRC
jgi:hypothetical protein